MQADTSLAAQVSSRLKAETDFSPAVVEALRLADLYADFVPEAFTLPTSDTFDTYRPLEINRMLMRNPSTPFTDSEPFAG